MTRLRAALLAAALGTVCVLALASIPAAGAARVNKRVDPAQCPDNCLSCAWVKGRIRDYPRPRSRLRNAGRHLLNPPTRLICLECAPGFTAKPPRGQECECASGHTGPGCTVCPPNNVKPPGPGDCSPCPPGQKPSADSSTCVTDPCANRECGAVTGPDGETIVCGTCTFPDTCNPDGVCENTGASCVPQEQCDPGFQCGFGDDGCNGTIPCGSLGGLCPGEEVCTNNVCNPPPCFDANQCPPQFVCGSWTNDCGNSVLCGECKEGSDCSVDQDKCVPNQPCKPLTSCPGNQTCGYVPDECGSIIPCGTPELGGNCPTGEVCSPDQQCVKPPDPCTPETQCAPGKVCGTQDDGCGGTIPCGNCPGGQFCAPNGLSCIPECVPKTECDDKYKCGTQPNGCGGQIPCGICPANYSCTPDAGTGGSICEPDPCVSDGQCPPTFVCGPAADNCGDVISCGTCKPGFECAANQTVCVPITPECIPKPSCIGGAVCGTQDDGCGGTLNCGACGLNQTCTSGKCEEIVPPPCVPNNTACTGKVCGLAPDGCGNAIECGNCTPGLVCSVDGTSCIEDPNICKPITSCTAKCGPQPDGCGGALWCGSCPADETCSAGVCVPKPCIKPGSSCNTTAECCGPDTVCDSSKKKCLFQEGGACSVLSAGCGACVKNCGNDKEVVCELYGVPVKECTISATGGGGRCAGTSVCCVIIKPPGIKPDANGICHPQFPLQRSDGRVIRIRYPRTVG